MTRQRMYRRAAYGLALLFVLVPTCAVVMVAVGAYRVATRASRRERRVALGQAAVKAAISAAQHNAAAYAAVDRRLSTVHIPAQRSAS